MNVTSSSTYGAGVRPLSIVSCASGSHALDCVTYSIENFLQLESGQGGEADRSLEQIFDYWSQQEGAVPSHFSPHDDLVVSSEVIRAVIDVRAENPMDFIMADHKVCSITGRASGWRGMPLGKLGAWHEYIRVRAAQYNLCRHTGVPAFYEIRHQVAGIESHFVVLLLPVSNRASGKTERIHSCVRRLSENQLVEVGK